MKEKIMIFLIGVLVGAIVATGAFLIYTSASNKNNQMPGGNPPSMPNGEMGQPPERADNVSGEAGQTNND